MASKSKAPSAQVVHPTAGQTIQTAEFSGSQFSSILAAIKQSEMKLDQKFADFRADMQDAQEEAATKAANRVRRDKPYDCKRKSHEEQASFNEKVQDVVKEARDALEAVADSPAIQWAVTFGLPPQYVIFPQKFDLFCVMKE